MKNWLGWIGGVSTFLYFVLLSILTWTRLPKLLEMDLNSVGDFLAGAFGPVAFFWLVLGFFQQGKELRISSDALSMQADELRASVEQQTLMVLAQQEVLEYQERALEPHFHLDYVRSAGVVPSERDKFNLTNSGNYCRQIQIEIFLQDDLIHRLAILPLAKDQSFGFSVSDAPLPPGSYKFDVRYEKISGKAGVQSFVVLKAEINGRDVWHIIQDKFYIENVYNTPTT